MICLKLVFSSCGKMFFKKAGGNNNNKYYTLKYLSVAFTSIRPAELALHGISHAVHL